jgi:hypothetical protein
LTVTKLCRAAVVGVMFNLDNTPRKASQV